MILDMSRTAASRTLLFTALFCFLLCAANASAQVTAPSGRAQSLDVSLGYAYINHAASPSRRISLNGVDAGATVGLSSRLGIRVDLGYARSAGGVLGAPTHASVLNYMAGPVFYPTVSRKYDVYVQALLGGARVSGPVPVSGGILIGGWANGFAWAVGGGVDHQLSDSIGVRAGVDYLRVGYLDPSLTIQGRNDVRATVAVVYFGSWPWKRRRRL